MVPGCVRILYAVACEAARMPTESGGAGPCPAACACPDIRSPTYRPRMGRDAPASAMRRMPGYTQTGIAVPRPAGKPSNRRVMYAVAYATRHIRTDRTP